eukprot:TRINITY_DN10794_c0_g1_i3.p3 TRINITY_DN10794_c0_g1~~TRINITY_DN10794_c0_g1_i3.p3  ORF type:complete len:121 (-),score=15.25 TRINITY_DN10794_c0_g1_i3:77-439(-)
MRLLGCLDVPKRATAGEMQRAKALWMQTGKQRIPQGQTAIKSSQGHWHRNSLPVLDHQDVQDLTSKVVVLTTLASLSCRMAAASLAVAGMDPFGVRSRNTLRLDAVLLARELCETNTTVT